MSTEERIHSYTALLDLRLTDILEILEKVPATITTIPLNGKAGLVIEIRELRDILRDSLKAINKALAAAEQHLCQTIATTDDGLQYRHDKGLVTATAKGYFNVDDPPKFFKWLNVQNSQTPFQEFVRYCSAKKELRALCDALLSDGKNLPDGIKEHIIAAVQIRRTKDE